MKVPDDDYIRRIFEGSERENYSIETAVYMENEKRIAELADHLNIVNSPEYDEIDDAISNMISEVEDRAFLRGFKCGVRFLIASLK